MRFGNRRQRSSSESRWRGIVLSNIISNVWGMKTSYIERISLTKINGALSLKNLNEFHLIFTCCKALLPRTIHFYITKVSWWIVKRFLTLFCVLLFVFFCPHRSCPWCSSCTQADFLGRTSLQSQTPPGRSRIALVTPQARLRTDSCSKNTLDHTLVRKSTNYCSTCIHSLGAKTSDPPQARRSSLSRWEWTSAERWRRWRWGWPSGAPRRRSLGAGRSQCGSRQADPGGESARSRGLFLENQTDCCRRIQHRVGVCSHCSVQSLPPASGIT